VGAGVTLYKLVVLSKAVAINIFTNIGLLFIEKRIN